MDIAGKLPPNQTGKAETFHTKPSIHGSLATARPKARFAPKPTGTKGYVARTGPPGPIERNGGVRRCETKPSLRTPQNLPNAWRTETVCGRPSGHTSCARAHADRGSGNRAFSAGPAVRH